MSRGEFRNLNNVLFDAAAGLLHAETRTGMELGKDPESAYLQSEKAVYEIFLKRIDDLRFKIGKYQ